MNLLKKILAQRFSASVKHTFSPDQFLVLPNAPMGWNFLFSYFRNFGSYRSHDSNMHEKVGRNIFIQIPTLPQIISATQDSVHFLVPKVVSAEDEHSFSYHYTIRSSNRPQAIFLSNPNPITGGIIAPSFLEEVKQLLDKNNGILIVDQSYSAPIPALTDDVIPFFYKPGILCIQRLSTWGFGTHAPLLLIGEKDILDGIRMNMPFEEHIDPMMLASLVEEPSQSKLEHTCESMHPVTRQQRYQQVLVSLLELSHQYPITYHSYYGGCSLWLRFSGLPLNASMISNLLVRKGAWLPDAGFFIPDSIKDFRHRSQCLRLGFGIDEWSLSHGLERLYRGVEKIYSGK